MASPSLEQARAWFEQRFAEVHSFNTETHPRPFSRCPNGAEYLTVINGRLRVEGDAMPPLCDSDTAIQDWFAAVVKLAELLGSPSVLWWRIAPQWENGRIYSRLIMTDATGQKAQQ